MRVLPALRGAFFARAGVRVLSAVALLLAVPALAVAQAPASIAPSARAQIDVLTAIKHSRSPAQSRLSSRLLLAALNARSDARLRTLPDFRFIQPDMDGRVAVEIILAEGTAMKPLLEALDQAGGTVDWRHARLGLLQARAPLPELESLAALPGVRRIREPLPAVTHAVNRSEGDATHQATLARGQFGATGAGVKVCVLSDGIDSLAALQASGDLPATIEVLPGQAGSGNEGAAMLEIIHDLAPDAPLGFATALPTQAQFAQNILDLAASGCQVIVDDIIYLAESPFQDGPVAQAVDTVTAAGVTYLSSAGNEGNRDDGTSGTWEGDFVPNATLPALGAGAGQLHDFGDGGQSLLVEFGNSQTPAILIWAEHYDLVSGFASTDYDLYVLNGPLTTVFDASADTQDGNGGDDFPLEFIGGGAFSGERLVVARFAEGSTSSAPMFNLILFRGEVDDALATGGTTRGHSAAAGGFSVAATPAAASFDGVTPDGPFPGAFSAANESEPFSADGPRRIILAADGSELTPGNRTSTGGVLRQKPDFTAADGVSTATPGFSTFFGTSAAAPHAAAIVALMRSAVPGLTPQQIRDALFDSAIDIEAPGVDAVTGAGIIMAPAALMAVGAEPRAFLQVLPESLVQHIGDGDAAVENLETWDISFPLQNIGAAAATGISATLGSSTPGVTIVQGGSSYADAAASATVHPGQPFRFQVGPSVICGSEIELRLEVAYADAVGSRAPLLHGHVLQTGALGAPVSASYSGAPVPIPDGIDLSGTLPGAPVDAILAMSDAGTVHTVTLSLDGTACSNAIGSTTVGIAHTFVNDLELSLVAPDGSAVLVVNNTDGGGNNFCQTVLDDASAGPSIQSVSSAQAPFSGLFTPHAPLSTLAGTPIAGDWALRAQDFFSSDTGVIRAWTLSVTPAVCDFSPVAAVAATKTVSGPGFSPGETVTYTIVLGNSGTGAQPDNPGDEFVDTLPAGLALVSATASSGSATANVATGQVSWNGSIPVAGSVTITIQATIEPGTAGTVLSNQGTVFFDADLDGSNESSAPTHDPSQAGSGQPTTFTVVQGQLGISPAMLDFGSQPLGTTGTPLTVTLANTGTASLGVTAIEAPDAPFALAGGNCGQAPILLAPGEDCSIAYGFTPAAAGAAQQTLAVTTNVPGDTAIVLAGTGTVGELVVSPAVLDFGQWPVTVGAVGSQSVLVSNAGSAPLQVTSVTPEAAPFHASGGSCGAVPFSLAAGSSCTLDYAFAPSTAGPFSQVLVVTEAGGSTAQSVLQGTGIAAEAVLSAASIDFGSVGNGDSAEGVVTLQNQGSADLEVLSATAPAVPFALAGGSCGDVPFTLAPGASCSWVFAFAPTAAGSFQGSAVFTSNDGVLAIALAGVGAGSSYQPAVVIPATSPWVLVLLGLVLGMVAVLVIRRGG